MRPAHAPILFPRGLVIAMMMSLLFIVLLRFLAGIMVWVMIVLVILVLGYGAFSRPSYFSPRSSRDAHAFFFFF